MRRTALLAGLVGLVALVGVAGSASGAVDRTPREVVENAKKGVRPAPDLTWVARANAGNRVRVIMTLDDPPLAAAFSARQLAGFGAKVRLNVKSSFARSYLADLASAQTRAIASLRQELPDAVVSRRYQVLLNGFAVSVPYGRLPKLLELGLAKSVYPSLSYAPSLNRGPAVIGGPQFAGLTGASGNGVKVAVVDDGVDHEHPFLDPTGLSYPPGFPKGPSGSTTPKVIVARGFAGPGANSSPLDRDQSFHGTFVAGIIAGAANTDVPAGSRPQGCSEASGGCHPAVDDLSGVAPRAYIGNYRVFNVPAPSPLTGCCSANTPEIVAAFEAAVRDGMDVINFSGGGPQADPRTDALIEAVANVVRAGVVPVISAGNDRDFFGLGTSGSPATAPDAISVGATANAHVFGASISVVSPGGVARIPFVPSDSIPPSWISTDQRLLDVGSIGGVSRQLCDAAPSGSLRNAIALVSRGGCPYSVKSARARDAGATGMVIAENRPGDPTFALVSASGGTISDLDGARLRAAAAGSGGAVTVRFSREILEVPTTWAGVPTSFTSSGLTPFGHALKPDVTAPGAQILSSTLPEFAGDQYAVLDGTSFSAPHVAGAAALLIQRHPSWTPHQVKSALMSTAGPALGDTTGTQEASVLVQGAGLVRVAAADKPLIFTDPQSLSFGYLPAAASSPASKTISVTVSDAGDGAGTWTAEIQAQVASTGATVEAAPVTLGPGGAALMQIVARAGAGAVAGDNFGFVVLRRGSDARRIPYAFSVTRSSLTGATVLPLRTMQSGDTRTGEDRARVYRWPTSPFSILGIFGVDPSVNDDGKEKIYALDITRQAVNAGVVVVRPAPKLNVSITALFSSNAPIHPWFLGSLDENDVLGYAGIPVNVNGQLPDFLFSIGASGGVFLPPGRYYVAVDSGRDLFNGRSLAGPYTLRSWVNDVRPPVVRVLTKTLSSGRPTIVAKVTDAKSGPDPLSFQLFYGPSTRREAVGATTFDPATGIAAFSIPREAFPLVKGSQFMVIVASDFQEAKNINTEGDSPMPNTRFQGVRAEAVNRPTITWITPEKEKCLAARQRLLVVANDNVQISSVGFFDGNRQIGRVRKNVAGLYEMTWRTGGKRKGAHVLTAVASDIRGREAEANQTVRVCK